MSVGNKATGPGLKYFIRRAEVLKSYRDLLKSTRKLSLLDKNSAQDANQQIKQQYRINKNVDANEYSMTVAAMLKDSRQQLEQINELISVRNLRKSSPNVSHQELMKGRLSVNSNDLSDVQFRVGTKFPWQSKGKSKKTPGAPPKPMTYPNRS